MIKYKVNPAWKLISEEGQLVISAGADRLFLLEELKEGEADKILAMASQRDFTKAGFKGSQSLAEAFDQLVLAEVFIPVIKTVENINFSLAFAGKSDRILERILAGQLPSRFSLVTDEDAQLIVLLRTNSSLKNLSEKVEGLTKPHVLVDVSYHHNISVGPLVVFGDTACVGCLAGRIALNWGDPEVPPKPKSQNNRLLLAGLILNALEMTAETPEKLINKTVVHDFGNPAVKQQPLLRYPLCKVCGDKESLSNNGQISLPWVS